MDLRLSDPLLVAQFRAEQQILAGLEHPALTRLLDGGMTALGEPYLVMEYVDGQPIDHYCDAQQLDLDGRLRLFAEVCEGVAYAHRNLVLHRDLKPSNMLVTADGHVKVVDFGSATLLAPDRLSTVSKAPLTPAFASPEQLMGQAVGTASDQYSLGLVLYELLTGTPPFAGRTSLMAAVERALARTTTTAPHTVVTAAAAAARRTTLARLRRVLSGDLSTIVAKTLAHDPAARYASVQHVADDLALWAKGEPILGRTPSLGYHASRFVRRHWVATAIAATLALALLGATVVSFQQAAIARAQTAVAQAESTKAKTESDKARQLNRFLTRMLSSADPTWTNPNATRSGSITVRQVLDEASQLVQTELGGNPSVEAEMQRTIAATYIGLGASDAGERHLDRALELYRRLGDAYGIAVVAHSKGTILNQRGRPSEAEAHLREAFAYARSRDEHDDPEFRFGVAADLALALTTQRPADLEALALLRESIALADRIGLNPGGTAVALQNLGLQLLVGGQLKESEATLRDAVRRLEALPSPPPNRFAGMRNLSELMRTVGNYPEAVRFGAAAAEGAAREYPADHVYQPSFKTTWGRALVANGDVERGRLVLLDALEDFRRFRPDNHPELSGTRLGLGMAYRLQGRLRESERYLREARASVAATSMLSVMASIAGELGMTLRASGRTTEANALLNESYTSFKTRLGDAHPYTIQALARLRGGE